VSKDYIDTTGEDFDKLIEKQKNLIETFTKEVNILSKQTLNESDKITLSNTLEFLSGINVKFNKLKTEKLSENNIPFTISPLPSEPYPLNLFMENFQIYQKILENLADTKSKEIVFKQSEKSIENELNQNISNYTKKVNLTPVLIDIYEQAAMIISLQIDYAIIKIQNQKNIQLIKLLKDSQQQKKKQLDTIFKNISITKKDISESSDHLKKITELTNSESNTISEDLRKLNHTISLYHIKLDNLRLAAKENLDDPTKLKISNIELIIEEQKFKQLFLEQRREELKLKLIQSSFDLDWKNEYISRNSMTSKLKEWKKISEDLKDIDDKLTSKLSEVRDIRANITEKLASTTNSEQMKAQLNKNNNIVSDIVFKMIVNKKLLHETKTFITFITNLYWENIQLQEKLFLLSKKGISETFEKSKYLFSIKLFSTKNIDITTGKVIIFLIFLIFGYTIIKISHKKLIKLLKTKSQLSIGAINSISTLSYYIALLTLLFISFSLIGINFRELTIILGALSVGIGFGLQTIANNFISGLILLLDRSVKVGDIIELENGVIGEVKSVSIRTTVVKNYDGKDIILPNSELISKRVDTWTYFDNWRMISIPFGVGYNSDPRFVMQIALDTAQELVQEAPAPKSNYSPKVFFTGYGESSIDFNIIIWYDLSSSLSFFQIKSDFYLKLFEKLKKNNIEIPFPKRDLNINDLSPAFLKAVEGLLKVKPQNSSNTL